MRITGGRARGIRLKSLTYRELRPAGDALREALFSFLGNRVERGDIIDFFAGTGAYGLEALSRGASKVTFVEKNRKISSVLKANIVQVCKSAQVDTTCCKLEVLDVLKVPEDFQKGSIVFMDAPYPLMRQQGDILLRICARCLDPTPASLLVVEFPADYKFPTLEEFEIVKQLGKKGINRPMIFVLKHKR